MRIHYLQHVPYEGPAEIQSWAKSRAHAFKGTHLYRHDPLPKLDDFDLLLVMGGPMGVYDEDRYPWLSKEKRFIKSAIQEGKYVFGVCLGAQLIADALQARIYPNHEKEIGWFPIHLTDQARKINFLKEFPSSIHVLHWHGDTFDLPKDAIHLMRSEACIHQAFSYQDNILAFQFHIELTSKGLEGLLENDNPDSLSQNLYVQNSQEIRSGVKYLSECQNLLFQVLDEWTEKRL